MYNDIMINVAKIPIIITVPMFPYVFAFRILKGTPYNKDPSMDFAGGHSYVE